MKTARRFNAGNQVVNGFSLVPSGAADLCPTPANSPEGLRINQSPVPSAVPFLGHALREHYHFVIILPIDPRMPWTLIEALRQPLDFAGLKPG